MNSALSIHLHIGFHKSQRPFGRPYRLTPQLGMDSFNKHQNNDSTLKFPYFTDTLLGLSSFNLLLLMDKDTNGTFSESPTGAIWADLEPLNSIYHRSSKRLNQLISIPHSRSSSEFQELENQFIEVLEKSCQGNSLNLEYLSRALDVISQFEKKTNTPLLFRSDLNFSDSFMTILHLVYSMLYNFRSLMAINYNTQCNDSLYESLPIDSVKDYLSNPEMLSNEAIFYQRMKDLFQKEKKKLEMNSLPLDLERSFRNILTQGFYLHKNLPSTFFEIDDQDHLHENLYTFQVGWLLGSPGGLLYRIRAELNGIKEGYEQIFWPELQFENSTQSINEIELFCEFNAVDFLKNQNIV